MAVSLACPQCRAVIRSPKPLAAGQRVKCPKCAKVFAIGGNRPQPAHAVTAQRPAGNPFGFEDPRPAAAAALPPRRQMHKSSVGMLNLSIFVVLLLVGAVAVAGAVYWGNTKPTVAVRETKTDTATETKAESTTETPKKVDEPKKDEAPPSGSTVNKGTGQENPIALVPGDATVVMGADIGKLAKLRPDLVELLKDAVLGNAKQYLSDPKRDVGLEFADFFDKVVAAAHIDPMKAMAAGPNAQPDFLTLIVKSKVPFDQKKVQASLPMAKEQKIKDKITFQIEHEKFSTAYMPSDHVLILTSLDGERLDALVAADGTKPMLPPDALKLIEQAQKGPFWLAVPFNDMMKQGIAGLAQQAGAGLPPALQPVVKAATGAQAAALWLSADQTKVKLSIGLACANDADAKTITGALQGMWNAQKAMVTKLALDGLKEAKLPPSAQALVKSVLDSVQAVPTQTVAELSVSVEIKTVETLAKEVAENPLVVLAGLQEAVGKVNQPKFALTPQEQQLLDLVNKEREKDELPKLKVNPTLFKVAREHAAMMAKINAADDEIDGKDTGKRAAAAGYKFEQITANLAIVAGINPPAVVNGWKTNAASKENMLDKVYTEAGVGFGVNANNQVFVSMVFAAPAK
jgi:uncharacterized protein YkwD